MATTWRNYTTINIIVQEPEDYEFLNLGQLIADIDTGRVVVSVLSDTKKHCVGEPVTVKLKRGDNEIDFLDATGQTYGSIFNWGMENMGVGARVVDATLISLTAYPGRTMVSWCQVVTNPGMLAAIGQRRWTHV